MSRPRSPRLSVLLALVVACGAIGAAAQAPTASLPLLPARERGLSVTPAYEGWFENADGSFSLLVGYYNRNTKETFDIPVGPDNRIEPGPIDQGQPTHFEVGRQWGVFAIKVPKDFGKKAVTWTIVANGEVQSIPLTLNPGYPIAPYKEIGMGNQPPSLAFTQGGPKVLGPPTSIARTMTAKVGEPTPLEVWVEDVKSQEESRGNRGPAGIATLSFHKFRGPGAVTFDPVRVPAKTQGELVVSKATFAAPGEYMVRVQANDESGEGGGGFQCCWTNTYVKVTVQ